MRDPIRILIADDHPVVRDGLAAILSFQPDLTVVGHAAGGHEAVAKYRELRPDVALVDLSMPDLDGASAIRLIRSEFEDARILVLTTHGGDEAVFRALQHGARGYLLKDCATTELLAAIREVHAGATRISPRAAASLASRAITGGVSPREVEVLRLIAAGSSNKEIASALSISEGTVKTHVLNILEKLGVKDRTEAVVVAIKRGIIAVG